MPQALRSLMSVIVGYLALWFSFLLLTLLFHQVLHGDWNVSPLLGVQLAISLIASTLGGYVCALVAGQKPLAHAGVIAVIMLISSLRSYETLKGHLPGWYLIAAAAGTPLMVLFGGLLDFQELKRRK